MDFPDGSDSKESTCNAGDLGLILGLGRSSEEGKGYPLQYFGLENFMDCMLLLLLSCFSHVQHLVTPWTSMEFSPGDFPNPGVKPRSPALQGDSLPSEPPGKP